MKCIWLRQGLLPTEMFVFISHKSACVQPSSQQIVTAKAGNKEGENTGFEGAPKYSFIKSISKI